MSKKKNAKQRRFDRYQRLKDLCAVHGRKVDKYGICYSVDEINPTPGTPCRVAEVPSFQEWVKLEKARATAENATKTLGGSGWSQNWEYTGQIRFGPHVFFHRLNKLILSGVITRAHYLELIEQLDDLPIYMDATTPVVPVTPSEYVPGRGVQVIRSK